jgi:hypothetical protein
MNDRWNAHLPQLKLDETSKVAIYTKKALIEGKTTPYNTSMPSPTTI